MWAEGGLGDGGVVQTEAVDDPQLVDLLISHRHDVRQLPRCLCLALLCSLAALMV